MTRVHGHAHAGAGHGKVGEPEDLAALVAELELFVRLEPVADLGHELAGEREHVERDRRHERRGRGEVDRGSRIRELGRAAADVLHLVRELVDALEPRPGHGLIGAHHDPPQPGGVVQRLERGHPHHRRAVGVGDDPLAHAVQRVGVDLAHDQRDVGVHSPRRGVVDDDGSRSRETGREGERCGCACREQREVDTRDIRDGRVFHRNVGAAPRQVQPHRTRRCEETEPGDGKIALVEDRTHDTTHEARRTHDADIHGFNATGSARRLPRLSSGEPARPPTDHVAGADRAQADDGELGDVGTRERQVVGAGPGCLGVSEHHG